MDEKCVINPSQDCVGAAMVADLREEFNEFKKHNTESHRDFYTRLSMLESHDLVQDAHYEHIIEKLTDVTNKLSDISTRLAAIELKPAKKWDGAVEKILFTIVGAVAMYFLAKLGM